jgi:ubiquinone/menaquinone biosynthesis C-methylase UbiE
MARQSGGPEQSASLPAAVYTLGSNPAEANRLRRQSLELQSHTVTLLDRVALRPGQSAIDLGCGPSGIIELLCDRVGPDGSVVGVDRDPALVALARALVHERGLTNVEIMEADARRTGLPVSSFDLVHARTLLINVPDPDSVVAEMARLVKPGGWVVGMEPDGAGRVYHPPNPVMDRLHEIFTAIYRQDGADPFIGRRLPELFREAGLTDVGVEARADVYPPGHSRRTIRPDLVRSMRAKIVERGIAGEEELRDLDRAAREYLEDSCTLVLPHLFFLTWGRKPAT